MRRIVECWNVVVADEVSAEARVAMFLPQANISIPKEMPTPTTSPLNLPQSITSQTTSTTSPISVIEHGRRTRKIPASVAEILPPPRSPPEPRHITHPTRIHHHYLAQSKRSAAISRETHNAGEEEYKCEQEQCEGNLLREYLNSTRPA